MDNKIWTFTTENDTVAPQVLTETPVRGSSGNSVSTNITIDIGDKKTYPGTISGSGVNSSTCRINVSSPSFALTTYQLGSPGTTVTAIDYGYRFTIDPASNFGQNEVISVSVYDCADYASPVNIMTTDNYTFSTADSDGPFVDSISPANDVSVASNSTVSFHIKDNGSGVDLTNTVIYLNGNYYTNGGGAGTVTTNGTKITFASSYNFNGGNYVGDTTARTGTAGDYAFVIDPQTNFTAGEAVPVIVYSRDLSGNLMERVVYALAVDGGSCANGSTFCGDNTSWDAGLAQCIGTGGGSSSGGGGTILPFINPSTVMVTQIDEHSVLVSWLSNLPGSGRVLYATNSPPNYGTAPNYDYTFSSAEVNNDSTYHAIVINNLQPGTLYYFRPITWSAGRLARGPEVLMAPRFGTTQTTAVQTETAACAPAPVCAICENTRPTTTPLATPLTTSTLPLPQNTLRFSNIFLQKQNSRYQLKVSGQSSPFAKITLTVN